MEFLVTVCLDVNNVLTRRVNQGKKTSRAVKHKDIKSLEVWEYMLKICLVGLSLSICRYQVSEGGRVAEPSASYCVEGPHSLLHV